MADEVPGREASGEIAGTNASTLYFCFFVSGIAGLIYEVLWAKYLSLYVGSTGLAQVIVLAPFGDELTVALMKSRIWDGL